MLHRLKLLMLKKNGDEEERKQNNTYNQSPFITGVSIGLSFDHPFIFRNCNQFWIVCLAHRPNGYPNCLLTILFFLPLLFAMAPQQVYSFIYHKLCFLFISLAAHRNDHSNFEFTVLIFNICIYYSLYVMYKSNEWTIKFNFSMEQTTNVQSEEKASNQKQFPTCLCPFFINYHQHPVFVSNCVFHFAIFPVEASETCRLLTVDLVKKFGITICKLICIDFSSDIKLKLYGFYTRATKFYSLINVNSFPLFLLTFWRISFKIRN